MSDDLLERLRIREVVESWVVWRDQGEWDRFRTLWHPTRGKMIATWFTGTAEDFIAMADKGIARGVTTFHRLAGSVIDVEGNRAVAQSKVAISLRDKLEGVLCDVTTMGRFYDLFEKLDGRWVIVLRQAIFEKDRADPVDPSQVLKLDPELLAQFPEGYRHLAYGQSKQGLSVRKDLPTLRSPEEKRVLQLGADWLAGKDVET